jgi:hypothetical protein
VAKKKSKRRDDDEDDDIRDFDETPTPKSDAYTGIVVITTLCLIAAVVMFYLDGDKFTNAKSRNPSIEPGALVISK